MKSRILIIDPSGKTRNQLSDILKAEFPGGSIYTYDPIIRGFPPNNFNWMTYDLVILSSDLGAENGNSLDWLRAIKKAEGSPGVILLCNTKHVALKDTFLEEGADEFLAKEGLKKRMLISAIEYIVKFNHASNERAGSERRKAVGPELPGYTVGKVLNSTEDSCLYLVNSDLDNRPYVVKALFSEWLDDDTLVERFVDEYELIHNINHPNVVKLHQLGFTEEFIYIIMDYLPGGSLFERIQEWNIQHKQAFSYLWQMTEGLHCLHEQGVLHRDLKPSNVMFRNATHLKLIDFGISKAIGTEDVTVSNVVMGTLSYMSPEAVTAKELDKRADVYSLGVIFYEILMGKKPFQPIQPIDVIKYHRLDDTFELVEHLQQFQPLIDRMTATNRNNRFGDMPSLQKYIKNHYAQYFEEE